MNTKEYWALVKYILVELGMAALLFGHWDGSKNFGSNQPTAISNLWQYYSLNGAWIHPAV